MLDRKRKRKEKKGSPNVCPMCRIDRGYYIGFVENPYFRDMYDIGQYDRMCHDCCDAAMGDI